MNYRPEKCVVYMPSVAWSKSINYFRWDDVPPDYELVEGKIRHYHKPALLVPISTIVQVLSDSWIVPTNERHLNPLPNKPAELAGHQKDPTCLQPRLLEITESPLQSDIPTKGVLRGDEDTTSGYVKTAHGWIELHTVKRKRKSGRVWENKQYWLH